MEQAVQLAVEDSPDLFVKPVDVLLNGGVADEDRGARHARVGEKFLNVALLTVAVDRERDLRPLPQKRQRAVPRDAPFVPRAADQHAFVLHDTQVLSPYPEAKSLAVLRFP